MPKRKKPGQRRERLAKEVKERKAREDRAIFQRLRERLTELENEVKRETAQH